MDGKAMHTLVMVPAMIRVLRPVALTAARRLYFMDFALSMARST
jgi:hypothetical protein